MDSPQSSYREKKDVPHFGLLEKPEPAITEQGPKVVVRVNDKGELIGIEILTAPPKK